MHWARKLFHRQSAREVLAEHLYEAERLQVEHQAAAEMHAALAAVYRMRMERTRRELAAVRPELHALPGGVR